MIYSMTKVFTTKMCKDFSFLVSVPKRFRLGGSVTRECEWCSPNVQDSMTGGRKTLRLRRFPGSHEVETSVRYNR